MNCHSSTQVFDQRSISNQLQACRRQGSRIIRASLGSEDACLRCDQIDPFRAVVILADAVEPRWRRGVSRFASAGRSLAPLLRR